MYVSLLQAIVQVCPACADISIICHASLNAMHWPYPHHHIWGCLYYPGLILRRGEPTLPDLLSTTGLASSGNQTSHSSQVPAPHGGQPISHLTLLKMFCYCGGAAFWMGTFRLSRFVFACTKKCIEFSPKKLASLSSCINVPSVYDQLRRMHYAKVKPSNSISAR
jgi:hypothetical protein